MRKRLPAFATMAVICMSAASSFATPWSLPPVPDQTAVDVMSGSVTSNGLPLKIVRFVSARPPAEVVSWYRTHWSGRVVVNRYGEGWTLGHQSDKVFFTVQLRPTSGGRQTYGIAAASDLGTAVRERHRHVELVSKWSSGMPYGTQVITHSASETAVEIGEHVAFINRAPLTENEKQLQNAMGERGLQLQRHAPVQTGAAHVRDSSGSVLLLFKGSGKEAMATISPSPGGETSIVVNLTQRRAQP